jgi:hypothetical protein
MSTILSLPPLSEVTNKCPHADIRFCPLYHASHTAWGLGCDDGKSAGWNGCGVSRALDYGRCLAELAKVSPQMIALCAFQENAEVAMAQRNRNMKAAGLH